MTPASRWIYTVSFLLASAGFLVPFWPLSVLGVLLCSFSGRYVFSLMMALLLDLAWGAPTGTAAFLFFPFAALSLAAGLARYWGSRYFLDRNLQERL